MSAKNTTKKPLVTATKEPTFGVEDVERMLVDSVEEILVEVRENKNEAGAVTDELSRRLAKIEGRLGIG